MLFDLRGRGRRRTVQTIYLGLALLMGGGLVLFGVGAGNGNGGLLNAFNGGSNSQNAVVSSAEKQALQQTKLNPTNPAGWAALVQARWTSSQQNGSQTTAGTVVYNKQGKTELAGTTQAWQKYVALTKSPDPTIAILAARANQALADYSGAADAWELETTVAPNEVKGYECLAANAYAAKQTRKGDLATAKAVALTPKAQQLTLKAALTQAKTNVAVAQSC
jgi:hypothetical protein